MAGGFGESPSKEFLVSWSLQPSLGDRLDARDDRGELSRLHHRRGDRETNFAVGGLDRYDL